MRKFPSSTSTRGASSKLPSPGCSCHQPHHIVALAVSIPPLAAISSHSFSPLPTQAPRTSSPPYGTAGYPNHDYGPCPAPPPYKYRSKRISWLGAPCGHSSNVDHHNSPISQFVSASSAAHAPSAKAILSPIIPTRPTCVCPSLGRSIPRPTLICWPLLA